MNLQNPYQPPATPVRGKRPDRVMWIEHRLREAYIGSCASVTGGLLYGRYHHHVIGTLPFPYDIVVTVSVWASLAAVAVIFFRLWRTRQTHSQQERSTKY